MRLCKNNKLPRDAATQWSAKWRPILQNLLLIFFLLTAGCTLAKVDVNVVSERTALENQVLGSYNALDSEMMLLASVRGVDPQGAIRKAPQRSQEHKDAVLAMQTQTFHQDDLRVFKQLKWVGENQDGLLTPFAMTIPAGLTPELVVFTQRYTEKEFKAVVDELNQAREVIMNRVIATNDNFTPSDLPAIRKVFADINRQNALPGEKFQQSNGAWAVK